MPENNEETMLVRWKYVLLTVTTACCILVGIYGAKWAEKTWLYDLLSCSVGVAVILIVCAALFALGSYLRTEGRACYRWVFALIVLIGMFAHLLGFHWDNLSNVALAVCLGLSLMAPSLLVMTRKMPKPDDDVLGRRLLYRRMRESLRRMVGKNLDHGAALVVSGPRGIGKSHFIEYLAWSLQTPLSPNESKARSDAYTGAFVVAGVDVWKSKSVEGMWEDIAMALAAAVSGYNIQLYNKWRNSIISLLQTFHLPVTSLADDVLRMVTSGVEDFVPFHQKLSRQILRSRKGYVLILDNLDRCDAEKRNALRPLIERLRKIRGLVTICGIAAEEIGETDPEFQFAGTFRKIFDLVVPLAPLDETYMIPFMETQVSKLPHPGKYLREWVKEMNLPFTSPRQVICVVRQLHYIDVGYMSRVAADEAQYHSEVGADAPSLVFTVFYCVVLELFFPFVSHALRKEKNPCMTLAFLVGKNGYERDSNAPLSDWETVRGSLPQKHLLSALLKVLVDCDEVYLDYALKQKYLHMSSLLDDECQAVLACFRNDRSLTPTDALKKGLNEEFSEVEAPPLYDAMIQYVTRCAEQEGSVQYMDACLKHDILVSDGAYAAMYQKEEKLTIRLLNSYVLSLAHSSPYARQWEKMAMSLLMKVPLELVRHALVGLRDCGCDMTIKTYDEEAPFLCAKLRELYKEISGSASEISAASFGKVRRLCERALLPLVQTFAHHLCYDLLSAKQNPQSWSLPLRFMYNANMEWNAAFCSGVEQFIDDGGADRFTHIARFALLRSLRAASFGMRHRSLSAAPALSFVLVWRQLWEYYAKRQHDRGLQNCERRDIQDVLSYLERYVQDHKRALSMKKIRDGDEEMVVKGTLELKDYLERLLCVNATDISE